MSETAMTRSKWLAWLILLRPQQWIKNGFVLLPALFGHVLFVPAAALQTLITVVAFCLTASAIYAFNDVADRRRDRNHPLKRHRPVASGVISPSLALATAAMLAFAGGLLTLWLQDLQVFAVILTYVLVNILYSSQLKRIAYIDVLVIATGFVLRVVAGGLAAQVSISGWIIGLTFLLSLMLALGKRYADVRTSDPRSIAAQGYTAYRLRSLLWMTGFAATSCYFVYTLLPHTQQIHATPWLPVTALPVAAGVARYWWCCVIQHRGGSPSKLVFEDIPLLTIILSWIGLVVFLLYPEITS